jgi:hypothetical protein
MARPREPRKIIVEPAGTFSVRLEEKPPELFQWQDAFRILRNPLALLLTGFFTLILAVSVRFLTLAWVSTACGHELTVNLEHPQWLATGDEGTLRFTIRNETSVPLTGTVVVHFWGPLPVQLGEGQSTRLEVQRLPPQSSAGYLVKFRIHSPPLFFRTGKLQFSVRWLTSDGIIPCRTLEGGETFQISLAPVHGLQGISRWLRSGPISLIALAFWEWAKKRILRM